MHTLEARFREALDRQKAGKHAEAERLYQQILDEEPNHAPTLHFLGVLAYQREQHAKSIRLISQAIELVPENSTYQCNLGLAYHALEQYEQAGTCFEKALELDSNNKIAKRNLGVIRFALGHLDDAVETLREATQRFQDDAEAYAALGKTLFEQRKYSQAAESLRKALELRPEFPEALHTLGMIFREEEEWDKAERHFRRATELKPDFAEAWSNLGAIASKQGRHEEAEPLLRRAIEIAPKSANTHCNLGVSLMEQGRHDEAVESLNEALRLKPDFHGALTNLGAVYMNRGETKSAMECLESALRIQPNDIDAHWNRGLVMLSTGDWDHGWLEYEWRWLRPRKRRIIPRPLWDGRELEGEKVLLHCEQGLGDTIQFVRFAREIVERGGEVILACQEALIPLLSLCPYLARVEKQSPKMPLFDLHCPLMSLPAVFRTTVDTVPDEPYIEADPTLVKEWGQRLEAVGGLKIGIVWQGNPKYAGDRQRSLPLAHFSALAELPGVQLISLQKGEGSDQLEEFCKQYDVLSFDDFDENGAFMDTAAIMPHLDLVVSSDTAIPHLAGALGRPVYMALPQASDWRWMRDTNRSPWYPTMRLFRQPTRGDWAATFENIAKAVRENYLCDR